MYIAPGLLDQRLGFFSRGDDGADGFQRPVYTKTGVYWGRVDATANAFTVAGAPQAHTDSRTTAVATVADYVPVDPYGIVKLEGDDTLWFVRGVYAVRQMACQQVTLEAIDPTAYGQYILYDAADVADGVHLVATSAFTTGFDEGFE
jgi:hypothetical protein